MSIPGFDELLEDLRVKLVLPADKPEEDHENTLRALWLAAAGEKVSAVTAMATGLPALDDDQREHLTGLVAKRIEGNPLAHLTERANFMGLEFVVGPAALIPRQETELLGTTARRLLDATSQGGEARCLDVGTGCGNLAIALALKCPSARLWASDISEAAIDLARQNVQRHGLLDKLPLLVGDLLAPLAGSENGGFDLIVCNPPYISPQRVPQMGPEIADHEPSEAFDGGFGGMAVLRKLVSEAPQHLALGGWLAFEVGAGQGELVIKQLQAGSTYREVIGICDTDGIVRVVTAKI